jgi:3-(3-hydroxy-phenyl)propionate hydroxylase
MGQQQPRRALPARCDVAIVGCGPTGAALANLLGRQGVSVVVIDRNGGVLPIPRAVHIDGETMRVFQAMGLGGRMLEVMRPGRNMEWVDRHGDTLLVRTGLEGLGPQGWHNDYYFHQPVLEQVLRDGLARHTSVDLFERGDVVHCDEAADGLRLTVADLDDGTAHELHCSFVVGCDGARSSVRAWIGEAHEDLGEHQGWLVVDGVLDHPLDLPEHTIQHCDPERPATSIYVNPCRRRWEVMLMPGDDPQAITQPEAVWPLLARWVRPGQARLERAATYVFHSLIAQTWRRGRLLIAGDAAHQTPPFLGQGLCAGIRDAANLGWKLARALRDPARADALLGSYESERKPHARAFIALAVEMGRIIQVTDAAQAAARDARLKAQGLKFAFPTPTLGPGVHRAGESPAGQVFLQPLLPDGRWLDDAAALRFCVLLDASAGTFEHPLRDALAAADALVVHDPGSAALQWMQTHGAIAVILRPDGYVFDACANAGHLAAALDDLRQWTGPPCSGSDTRAGAADLATA